MPICTADASQYRPTIVSDGSGGAIITWNDGRSGSYDIYAQRVNADGDVQWMLNGVAISAALKSQYNPKIVSDGSGGAIITWTDMRRGSYNYDIYAQRVNTNGNVQWMPDGVFISREQFATIVADGSGGAIITWGGYEIYNIYAQRVDADGNFLWTPNDGVAICTASGKQRD